MYLYCTKEGKCKKGQRNLEFQILEKKCIEEKHKNNMSLQQHLPKIPDSSPFTGVRDRRYRPRDASITYY
jgi:hypothetical protein